jgi:hypothetical protein
MTAIEVVNEVRKLIGLNEITSLLADKHARVALRLLNGVVSKISNAGNWQEMLGSARVTAVVSTRVYSIGINRPVKNIFEVAISGRAQALDPIGLSDYQRYERAGGTGTPAMFAIRGIDLQTNPQFAVHPQPSADQDGNMFHVLYYKKPPLYLTCDADTEIPFAANLVISGLYASVLEEEAGGVVTRESMMAARDFETQLQEELNRYDADSGGDTIQLTPAGIR